MFDAQLRLLSWNRGFAALTGTEDDLREGLGLGEVLRRQAQAGRFGLIQDFESEIAHRLAAMQPENGAAGMPITGPDGIPSVLRTQPLPDGGLVVIVSAVPHLAHETEGASVVSL
jgi:PAS domain-containing protein